MKLRGMAVVVFALGTHGLFGAVVSGPAVNSGTINYQTNQVTLIGAGFKPATTAPTVAFSNTALSLVSATNNQIVAKLPGSVAPGTFSITVTASGGASTVFDLSYGATGPLGLIGPQGAAGAKGQAGCQGTPGAQGPAGPQGSQGVVGPAGPSGPTGPEGPAGPAAAAPTLVVANQAADVAIPGDAQNHVINSIVLPNAGTYLIQGQEAFEADWVVSCWVDATPVNLHFRPSLGLPGIILGSTDGASTYATVPIIGYYIAPQAGMTLTLWCRTTAPATAFARSPGDSIAEDHAASMLTALQVQ